MLSYRLTDCHAALQPSLKRGVVASWPFASLIGGNQERGTTEGTPGVVISV